MQVRERKGEWAEKGREREWEIEKVTLVLFGANKKGEWVFLKYLHSVEARIQYFIFQQQQQKQQDLRLSVCHRRQRVSDRIEATNEWTIPASVKNNLNQDRDQVTKFNLGIFWHDLSLLQAFVLTCFLRLDGHILSDWHLKKSICVA